MSNCLVTGGSREDVAPIAVLLLNVRQTQSWVDHVVVYHDGISSRDQRLMQTILPVEFIRYHFPGNTKRFNEIVRYVYTPLVFCKYECFQLLKKYDNVLWTDYDVVIQRDLQQLLENNPTGFKSLIYRKSEAVCSFRSQLRPEACRSLEKDGFQLDSASIATGLFCLSRELKNVDEIYRCCIAFTEGYGQHLVLPDQAILNMVIAKLQLRLESIPWIYAVHPEKEADQVKDAFILHAYSQPKFWNGLHNETWQRNYAQWLQMGGSPWRPWSLRKIVNKFLKSASFVLYHTSQKLKSNV